MVLPPSFSLTDVTRSVTFPSSSILMDREYGGLHLTFGGMGRRSAFSLVLDNLDGDILNFSTNNSLAVANRDEIKLYASSPSENITNRLIFHGIVTKAARPIGQDHEHVAVISGLSFFDFWNDGRYFERDYYLKPDTVRNALIFALQKTHANFGVDTSLIPTIDTLIYRKFIACTPADALIDICAANNKELYIGPDDKAEVFDINSQDNGLVIDDSRVLLGGELDHSSEESDYDEIKFLTNNPYFAPNNATPTTTSFTDDVVFWRFLDPDFNFLVYFDPLNLDPNYAFYDAAVAKQMAPVVFKAGLFGGIFQTIGVSGPKEFTLTQGELMLSGSHTTNNGTGDTRLGLVEEDWESMNITIQNGFKGPTSFKIKLYDDHAATGGDNNYWESKELITDLSIGVVKVFSLLLPSNPDVEMGFWTATGSPTTIDRVGLVWRGGTDYAGPTFLSNVYFQGMVRSTKTRVGAPAWARQKVETDRTVTDLADAEAIATAELARLTGPAVIGRLNVEGSLTYVKPGVTTTLNFADDGFSNVQTRIDAIQHHVVENEYSCDLYFAPMLVKNSLWNRLAEISLRKNVQGEDNIYAAAESAVGNAGLG